MSDMYDVLEEKVKSANARASKLAARLRDRGIRVEGVTEADYEADAEVTLDGARHVQVGVDGTYTLVTIKGEAFIFAPATRSAPEIIRQVGS